MKTPWLPAATTCAFLLLVACGGPPPDGQREEAGAREAPPPGRALLEYRVVDVVSGEPIQRCAIVGWEEADTFTEVSPMGMDASETGEYRLTPEPMAGRFRVAADGYAETWSPWFEIAAGETKRLEIAMGRTHDLVVHVREADGAPVPEGDIVFVGTLVKTLLAIEGGTAEKTVPPGPAQLVVDPRFLEGSEKQVVEVDLAPGGSSEHTITVTR